MPDPMYPRIPSFGSMITFGINNPKTPRTILTEDEAFIDAMKQRGVTPIQNEEPKE